MNKLLTTIIATSFAIMSFAGTANSMEFKVGVTGQSTGYYANATEKVKDAGNHVTEEAIAAFSYMSVFTEVSFDEAYGITVGVEYTPESIKLEKADRVIQTSAGDRGLAADAGEETGTQVIEAAFNDLMVIYAAVPLMDTGLHVKAGLMSATLVTKENLATGSTYGNKTVNGGTVAMYYDGDLGSSAFYRIEGAYNAFDDISMRGSEAGGDTGSFNVIDVELAGVAAKVSVGMKF
jgi:hypothetical protein